MSLLLLLKGAAKAPATETANVAVTREYPSEDLAAVVTAPSGAKTRWAADESDAGNVISDLELSDDEHGDKECTARLSRDPRVAWPDLVPFSDVRVHLPGGYDVGNYRLEKASEDEGGDLSISPAAVGYWSAMEDNQAVMVGFIRSLLSAWQGPPAVHRKVQIENNRPVQTDAQVVWDTNVGAALRLEVQGKWESPVLPRSEGWFDSGSAIRVATVLGDWANGDPNTNFEAYVYFTDDLTTFEGSGEFYSATSGHIQWSPATGRRYVVFVWAYNATPAGVDGGAFAIDLTNLKVVSSTASALPLAGTWPNIGFTAKQILGYAVPKFTELKAEPEDLEDTGYVIQDAWYDSPTTVAAIAADVTKYDLLDCFVMGREKRFRLKRSGTYGRRWRAYAGPSNLQDAGLDASRLFRRIMVAFPNAGGSTNTVGWIGSGADYETAALEIADSNHPAVQANVQRDYLLTLSNQADAVRAQEAGEIWLREAFFLSRSGSADLSGLVLDDRGVFWPASAVRYGDLVSFPDAADPSPRKVTARNYSHATRTVSVTLDAPPEGLAALLERMQADITALQLS